MKIAITGALGHIGSKLIRDIPFEFPDAEIIMIDNMLTQRYCSLFNLPSQGNYKFIEGDILTANLEKFFENVDIVIHLAAITNAEISIEKQEEVELVNYTGTEKVINACLKTKSKLIFLSTTSVYGTQKLIVDENCSTEDINPQSPYADSKLKSEKLLKELASKNKLSFVICRFGTICGVSPGIRFHTAINKFCWQAINKLPITVWETALNQKRPYLTIDDAISSLLYIIKNDLFDNGVYNILTSNLTVSNILNFIEHNLKDKIEIKLVSSKIMNQLSYEVSCLKIKNKGLQLNGSIEKNIRDTINLLNHSSLSYTTRVSIS